MNRFSTTTLAACLAIGLFGAVAAAPANAKSNFMAECSAKYKAAKASGSLDPATKWTDFMKTQCASQDQSTQTPTPAVKSKASTTASAKSVTPSKTAAASNNASFMQQCSNKWQALKQAGNIPAGLKWTSFVKQGCDTSAISGNTQDNTANAVPAEPTTGNYAGYQSLDVATTDKNGKPFTQGQIAAHKRIKECAVEWHNAKQGSTLPAGTKWPQYWSDCNSRLKGQG